MTVQPTYPGVYIQEIPSGVHTISGVSTSIAAFIGFTVMGPVNQPVHIFSFADFQRAFGGLTADSPVSYCVRDFFQNGGTEAYVVRVARNAAAASVQLKNGIGGPSAPVLAITASSAGTWGNSIEIGVDYNTSDPGNKFNLSATSYVVQNGQSVPASVEVFRNLTMNPFDSGYAIDRVNAGSQLVSVTVPAFAVAGTGGTSTSGALTNPLALTPALSRVAFMLDGTGPFEVGLSTASTTIAAVGTDLQAKINAAVGSGKVTVTTTATTIVATSSDTTLRSSFRFVTASANDATAYLKLGSANGGTEADLAARYRPALSGTVAAGTPTFPLAAAAHGAVRVSVYSGASGTAFTTVPFTLWTTTPANMTDLLASVRNQLSQPSLPSVLAGATASVVNGALQIVPSDSDPGISFEFLDLQPAGTDDTATTLKLTTALGAQRNVARYALGSTVTAGAQVGSIATGNNGIQPTQAELTGLEVNKTGIYALANVDLFNLLVIPEATADAGLPGVISEAIAYCERRRAFMIVDAPETVVTFSQAQSWIGSSSVPRSQNAALYFPRITVPDPLMGGVVRKFPAAGALAGLYARTDGDRGVWKAPAGTSATLTGATGLSYTLTDGENGALNPLGLNCLRSFPVYGQVCWGARTANGADAMADEYKYIPVRRLALFLEESLYRGTQWAVFEPNDEPLWAAIRLNLGAFMHQLFAQGAFQGRSPNEAYFVRCDKTTTTQNDIDLGRVNIIVGFAPLKPAEFVIIQIQQMAGQIVT